MHKFASCDGCQLSILALEDELRTLTQKVDIQHFAEAKSGLSDGPFDVSLVEGSITTPHDEERIRWVRRVSRRVVAIGACATTGGIQALRNFADVKDFLACVYPQPEMLQTLAHSTPISAHIPVDFELQGCPVNKEQLKEVILAFAAERAPLTTPQSVCLECKQRGVACLMVTRNTLCLGPVTHGGCGAICPAYGRGCYGCFGPSQPANTSSFLHWLGQQGHDTSALARAFALIHPAAPVNEKTAKMVTRHD